MRTDAPKPCAASPTALQGLPRPPFGLVQAHSVWQARTPDGDPLPIFKRRVWTRASPDEPGTILTNKMIHGPQGGCPSYEPVPWLNHVTKAPYTPSLSECGARCGVRPESTSGTWPALPIGFSWKCLRVTDPPLRVYKPGRFSKCRLAPRGHYLNMRTSSRMAGLQHESHPIPLRGEAREPAVKNWKQLYTRLVSLNSLTIFRSYASRSNNT